MKIRLADIPAEGRSFKFDRKTGELNKTMSELVQAHPYDIEFTIRPIGNAYELRGQVATTMTEVCSLCGWDVDVPVKRKVSEILMQAEELDRKAKSMAGNQGVDFESNGPTVFHYEGDSFDTNAYVFEAVSAAEPLYPSCGLEDCEHLEEAREIQAKLKAEFEAADMTEEVHPGLAVLKDLNFGFDKN